MHEWVQVKLDRRNKSDTRRNRYKVEIRAKEYSSLYFLLFVSLYTRELHLLIHIVFIDIYIVFVGTFCHTRIQRI